MWNRPHKRRTSVTEAKVVLRFMISGVNQCRFILLLFLVVQGYVYLVVPDGVRLSFCTCIILVPQSEERHTVCVCVCVCVCMCVCVSMYIQTYIYVCVYISF